MEEGKEERILGEAEGEGGPRSQEQSNIARAAWIDPSRQHLRSPSLPRGWVSLLPTSLRLASSVPTAWGLKRRGMGQSRQGGWVGSS